MQFYEELSKDYDTMTQFEARFEKEKGFFEDLVREYGFRQVLDAGCGTGFHAILLAKLGLEVTGIDGSSEMLKKAMENASAHDAVIRFQQSSFQELSLKIQEKFDAVFCMGNSLPHLLTDEEIVESLENFFALLNEGGILVIQNLNYDRIMRARERILNVKQSNGKIFVRFYDFSENRVRFNILMLEENGDGFSHKLISTDLRPLYKGELFKWLRRAGFCNLRSMGSLALEKFSPSQSRDLLIMAEKRHTDSGSHKMMAGDKDWRFL